MRAIPFNPQKPRPLPRSLEAPDGPVPFVAKICPHGRLVAPAGPCPQCPGFHQAGPPDGRPYSAEERLFELRGQNLSAEYIGRLMDRTTRSVETSLKELRKRAKKGPGGPADATPRPEEAGQGIG